MSNRNANILRLAASALSREQGRLGKAEGIVTGARKLARIVWAMIVSGRPYAEEKAFATTLASRARRLNNLRHQAKALNLCLVPAP